MHCCDLATAPASLDPVTAARGADQTVPCRCGQRLWDEEPRDERFDTSDPQALLDEVDGHGLLTGRGPLLLLLRGWGADQRLAGWAEPRPGLAPELGIERAGDGSLGDWWVYGDGSTHDQVIAALVAAGYGAADRWRPLAPGTAKAALVLRRPGRVVFGPEDEEWLEGLVYGTNHAGTQWTDCYLVTEHGWSGYLASGRGAFGATPALHLPGAAAAGRTVGGSGQSGAP